MGHVARWLAQEQAEFGSRGNDPSATGFARQGLEIDLGLETQERETEAVLPGRFAVAGAAVAPELAADRHDFVREIDRLFAVGAFHMDANLDRFAIRLSDELGRAVRDARRQSLRINAHHRAVGRAILDLPGQITNAAVGV